MFVVRWCFLEEMIASLAALLTSSVSSPDLIIKSTKVLEISTTARPGIGTGDASIEDRRLSRGTRGGSSFDEDELAEVLILSISDKMITLL